MKIFKIVIIIALFISCRVQSQSGILYTSDSQLSSSLINSMYQDSKGYIWIATEDGLNRYDGAKFVIYKRRKNTAGTVHNNYIKSIFEDRNKNLFFGFIDGLQIYNHATDSFTDVPMTGNTDTKFSPHVSCMIQRKNGDILVGSSGYGIFKIDSKKKNLAAKHLDIQISTTMIHDLYEDKNQNLWILTQDRGLWRIDSNNNLKQFILLKDHLTNITSICEDKKGNLFLGTLNNGLFIYNRSEQKFESFLDSKSLPIKKLFLIKNDQILVGTDGMGLYNYDSEKKKLSVANFNVANFDFSMSKVHSILKDRAGNLWMGLYQKGVLQIPPKENNFNYIGYQSVNNNIIGSSCVMSVFRDRKGILWVGTDGGGLYGITDKNKKKYHYTFEKNGFSRLAIMCIFEDSNDDLWIGTYLHGLAKLNRSTNQFDFINTILSKENKPVENIYSLVEDQKKQLWIGTLGSGLYCMDLTTHKVADYNSKDSKNTLGNWCVNCLLPAKNNKLYIGTYDGLYCMDLKTKTFIKKGLLNHTFPKKIIYDLHEDKLGNLWIGSSEGLIYQPIKGKPIIYTTDNNLPSNIISAIQSDKSGNLWISTNSGISRFSPRSKKFFNFNFNDGIQGNEFSKNASFQDSRGQIIFGGMKGVTYFDPEMIKYNEKSTNVYITGFYIQNKSVKKGMKSDQFDIVNSALIDAKTVDLGHDDNSFSIEFSTMDFNNQRHITYFYSLENNKWNKLQQGINNITFNNLEPGTYNFKVKAEVYGKYSGIRQLTITVHPAWYFSIWAKLFYWAFFFGAAYVTVQQINQRKLTKIKLQEHLQNKQVNEAKLQFLTNISHDIKSPISLVINPLLKLMSTDHDITRQKSYMVMHRNSEKILQLVNQVMDVRKIDQGQISLNLKRTEIINSLQESCLLFEEQIQTKNIELELHYKKPELYAWIDPKYFDRIIQNVLSNAVKFVPNEGKIEIFIEGDSKLYQDNKEISCFTITIADNGIGINENELAKIFDRFYQSSNSRLNHTEGTGIGLHLTRSIVELHNGSITAENNIGASGCRFIIQLPMRTEDMEVEKEDEDDTHERINNLVLSALQIPSLEPVDQSFISTTSKKRILVVDDNDEIREYLFKELAAHYKVVTSINGKEALEIVLKDSLDLIISDVKMPVMDGVTFCRKVKKNININHIPVILLTANSHDHDQLEGLNIGADAYITKPFNMEILKKTVLNLIRTRELLKNNYSGNQAQEDKIKKITMESSDEKLIQKIMNFVNNNLSDPNLNVEMIASEIGISRVHLHRKLKELTNQSSRDLIRNIRLKQAGELLASKQMNISEVAYLVGFSNVSKFSTSFKQFYGTAPKEYMEEKLKKNGQTDKVSNI
ncbi:hybrid sensor histidine kinase/response regulator transcription factor [Flavobacterium sp. HJJ]|uniref:hybrid sensor histidine kinase/response regulator transcription factor n=1 Tax=Flavobacterium sp. HJJ TaxID=2783792 RepID=UPI00188BD57D|nr:hybrid sensor histidine kinase/response regulator transcription factor [Flavobacterium sp. HJJ]MBF4470551.1 response regulator [Flavobacterium sp. HJJ]